ncbi:MAG: gamma-glutamylcyclotransferase [Flavobacteriales bacterium]|nr:gamma-glutamylcyclotransferase [Flavobacteriales bacterium]
MEKLFSYGTLQLESVQMANFGRRLHGNHEVLKNYKVLDLEIKDKKVIEQSGKNIHPIAMYTGNPADEIEGILYEITKEELKHSDEYEVSDYKRILVTFESGNQGWIYTSH